jgi:hypothetical protein
VCYAAAPTPLGPYKKAAENPILKFIEGEISGPGHNSFFTGKDGSLLTAFHIHTDIDAPGGNRRACFSRAGFTADGKLRIYYE